MANWTIKNINTNGYLAISNYNGSSVSNNQNVTIMTVDDIANCQNQHIWSIDSLGTGVFVKSYVNNLYGLNVYRSGSPYNCDIHIISGNETDAKINFMYHANTGVYKIKLTNYNYYLTASGGNVYWDSYLGENNLSQSWSVKTTIPNSSSTMTEKILTMPQNINQRYSTNDEVIKTQGCCVCCVCDVASYYNGSNYTLTQMKNYGVYSSTNAACHWGNVPSAYFTDYSGYSQNDYLTKIRSEIDLDRPVLIYMTGTYQHWVVAYGYTNGGTSYSDIKVLDPYGHNTTSPNGRDHSLDSALSIQSASTINCLRLTSPK